MDLESPQGHFTDEKIQSLYNGTHLKGKHQLYDSSSNSSSLPSPVEIHSDVHSQDGKTLDPNYLNDSSDSDSFSTASNKAVLIKEIF